jgi:hypothetical protein
MPLMLLKYWRVFSLLAILAGLGISHYMAYNKGVETERHRNTSRVIEIEKAQGHIRNLRPDDEQLIDSLRDGNF